MLLGKFNTIVQSYAEVMGNQVAIIAWSITNVTAEGLIRKYPGVTGVTSMLTLHVNLIYIKLDVN